MSRKLGKELPAPLLSLLDGHDLAARAGKAILVTTVDAEGFPHPALLSYGEVVAVSPSRLRIATYRDSTTSNNMRRNGKMALCLVEAGMAYYIKGSVREAENPMAGFPQIAKFEFAIEQILEDYAREDVEADARITSGITFVAARPDHDILADWGKMVAALRR